MELKNTVEICVAIYVAIIGIAYPIIVDKTSNIGDKYSSQYIPVVFGYELPQKAIGITFKNRRYSASLFKILLYTTLFLLLFLVFQTKPWFGWDNWIVNNSANLLVFVFSSSFAISFFVWLDKVSMYNGNSTSLLRHLIYRYGKNKNESEVKNYYLKAINELTLYSIEKQDEHMQKTLLDFYYSIFASIRKSHDKNKPLIYPVDLYFLVNKLSAQVANNENKKLKALEHRAVSGIWLLGEDFENISISEETYSRLWSNIVTICDSPNLTKLFWANSSQYYTYRLKHISQEYSSDFKRVTNQDEVDKRNIERDRFIELHFALGGLAVYRKQYALLKYILKYSQSQPPRYVLLPESMTEIFTWFERFRNDFKNTDRPIDNKYYFPELDNLGNSGEIVYWICCYFAVLFIRQYSLHQYYTFQNFTALPNLPDSILELNNWLDSVSYFERCLNNVLTNDELLIELAYEKLAKDKSADFQIFLKKLRELIIERISQQKSDIELSTDKIDLFLSTSGEIITKSFDKYRKVVVINNDQIDKDGLKSYVTGGVVLMHKSSFTDDDIPSLNFDSVFAGQVASHNIERLIPNSFFLASTERYLLNADNLIVGLNRVIDNNPNAIIVGIDISYEAKTIIENSKYKDIINYVPSSEYELRNSLFILVKSDLPVLKHEEVDEETIKNYHLSVINDERRAYASVVDINKPENDFLRKRWADNNFDEDDLRVQLSIIFTSIVYWSDDREVIQINIDSEYREQGAQSDINSVKRLSKE